MATNIVGQFPVLNRQKSQTDEYGFDYITYEFTLKTATLDQYRPKKDDVFNGILISGYADFNNPSGQPYVVENVEITPMDGGLSALTVQTVGANTEISVASPKVFIRHGGPLIFGLQGNVNFSGRGAIAGAGQEIEVKFMDVGGSAGENNVYAKFYGKLMPEVFRNTRLPTPTSKPKSLDATTTIEGGFVQGLDGSYYGFVCKRIITERRGALILVSLFYSEAGFAVELRGANPNGFLYNFPVYG